MNEIKRYSVGDVINYASRFTNTTDIEYVSGSDHEAETTQLKARIAELEAKVGPLEEMQRFISGHWKSLRKPANRSEYSTGWRRCCGVALRVWANATAKAKRDSQ